MKAVCRRRTATQRAMTYDGFFGGLAAESRLRYPEEPPYVPTLLPTVGPMDYRLDGRVLKTFEVRCVGRVVSPQKLDFFTG